MTSKHGKVVAVLCVDSPLCQGHPCRVNRITWCQQHVVPRNAICHLVKNDEAVLPGTKLMLMMGLRFWD